MLSLSLIHKLLLSAEFLVLGLVRTVLREDSKSLSFGCKRQFLASREICTRKPDADRLSSPGLTSAL